jgi:ribosome biogenesis GTPase
VNARRSVALDNARAELATGLVVAAFRRHYAVELDAGRTLDCVLKGRTMTLACGDRVRVAREATGGAIVSIEPRTSLLFRSDAFRDKLIAANVTQVLGVVAPDVPVDEHLLNRWIIAAETARCRFVLVLNKADLAGSDALAARFVPYGVMGYAMVTVSARRGVSALRPWVAGHRSGVAGQPF